MSRRNDDNKRPREGDNVDVDDGELEEEPEGEDLFGDDYMRDYLAPDEEHEEDDESIKDEAFVDDRSDVSEVSDRGRMEVDALIQERERVEKENLALQRQNDDGIYSDDSGDIDAGMLEDQAEFEGEAFDAADEGEAAGGDGPSGGDDAGTADGYRARDEDDLYDEELTAPFDWKEPNGALADWVQQEEPRRIIKNRIFRFLWSFTVNKQRVYQDRVHMMTRYNGSSFEVSYLHLGQAYNAVLAEWIADVPELMFETFDEVATYLVLRKMYPHYSNVHSKIHVRIADLPVIDPIREFRQIHMNVLVRVEGVVIRRSPVYPQLQAVRYDCVRCSYIIGPVMQRGEKEVKVNQCPSCHSKGPFRVNMALTEYRSHQTLVIQEPPGKVPPGRLPRSLEVVLTYDLIDRAKPGEEIDVTGVYKNSFDPVLNHKQGFPVFTTLLYANNVTRRATEVGKFRLPDDEKENILRLARHPNVKQKLIRSMAPSIHGRDDIKLGLLLCLLSGVPKDVGGNQSHRIRGDINCLIVGDPGVAKSQFLKFVEKTANRAVFTTGRGSSAVGLTAAVTRDAVSGDFNLEGGALVIADRGVCLIDEFDKMSEQDRTSIHEAMEQQTIAVARAGIVTTLQARASIIAAANPIGGRYDPSVSFDANVDLTTPILSRFDLLFVVRDEVNVEQDMSLANFVCESHIRSHPRSHSEAQELERQRHQLLVHLNQELHGTEDPDQRASIEGEMNEIREDLKKGEGVREDDDPMSDNPLPQKMLRDYLMYAKAHCQPRIANIDESAITKLYTELRQESKHGGVPITVRHMESILRLSEAHARMHLREYVRDEDVSAAVALFLRCFLQTQKYSMRSAMEKRFQKYLEADVEPVHLLHHRLHLLINQTRSFERHISGGVEPVTVWVDCSELDDVFANINVSGEALQHYYASSYFKNDFQLETDEQGVPRRIGHTKVDVV